MNPVRPGVRPGVRPSLTRAALALLSLVLIASACASDGAAQGTSEVATPSTLRSSPVDGQTADGQTTDDPTSDPDQAPPVTIERPGPLVGIAVPNGRAAEVRDVEVVTGATFDIIRLFARWDDAFPNADAQSLIDANRRIHISVRPMASSGEVITWAELATAQPGDARYEELVDWIDRVVALGPGTYFTINHEPETADSRQNGSSENFVAMWRRTVELLRERGGDEIRTVWTMTNGAFSDARAEAWYPGDDVVDVVGTDVYNWHTCQGTDRPWLDLEELLVAPIAFARNHDKPLALPELASVEDRDNLDRKAEWIINAERTLLAPGTVDLIEFVIWFDVTAPGGTWPDCVWDYDTSPAARDAFAQLMLNVSGQT